MPGRSPPCTDLILNTKDQIGGKHMEGRHPKRRKDKYNPYQIYEKDGKHYILFKDGEEIQKCMEIERTLYEEFNSFELQDLSYLNVVDRHLEQSEIWDSSLYERATKKEVVLCQDLVQVKMRNFSPF